MNTNLHKSTYRIASWLLLMVTLLVVTGFACLAEEAHIAEKIDSNEGSNRVANKNHAQDHGPELFDINLGILVSQTINFFVLLFILKKLLFSPIGKILDERRKQIGKIRLETEKENDKAKELKKSYEEHLEKIREEAYALKQKAIKEAEDETREIIEEAKRKAEQIVEKGEMDLFLERQTAWASIREDVVKLTLMAAEKVVEKSLDEKMHRELINRTIENLEKDLPDHTQDKI